MRVLSIDPGTTTMGWAVIDFDKSEWTLKDSGYVQFNDGDTLLEKLNRLFSSFILLVSEHQPNLLMFERTWRVDRSSVALVAAIRMIKETADLIEDLKSFQENAMRVRKHFGVGARDRETAKAKVKAHVLETFELDDDLPQDVYDAVLLGMWLADNYKG